MTKTEFLERHRAFERVSNRFHSTWGILFFAFLLINIPIAKHIEGQIALVRFIYGASMTGIFVTFIFAPLWFAPRLRRRFNVFCQQCGKPLVGCTAQIAIATGNCGHCGSTVFTDASTRG